MNSSVETPPASRQPWVKWSAIILGLLAVYVLPRAVVYQGISDIDPQVFGDQIGHLNNLDLTLQRYEIPPGEGRRAFFVDNPQFIRVNPSGWPRGVYEIARLWGGRLGVTATWTTQLTNFFFSIILAVGLVGLGAAMGSLRIGVWATLLAFLCPPLVGATYYLNLDYPLTAMVAVGLLLLWHTRGFASGKYSVAFGAWSALAVLVKTPYPLFLFFPALWAFISGLGRSGRRAQVLIHGLLAAGLALGLFLLLVDVSLENLWHTVSIHVHDPYVDPGDAPGSGIMSWTMEWFLAIFKFMAMSFPGPLLLLSLPGLYLLHTKRKCLGPRALLLITLWSGCVLLTLIDNKLERYLHPLYPLICLVTVWGVITLLPRRWQTAAVAGVAGCYALVLGLMLFFPAPWTYGSRTMATENLFYDLRMPTLEEFQNTRHAQQYPSCNSTEMAHQISALSRLEGTSRVLGLTTVRDLREIFPEMDGAWFLFRELFIVTRIIKHRIVTLLNQADGAPLPNAVIFIHTAEETLPLMRPPRRFIARREVTLRCEERELRLLLSLYSRGALNHEK